MTSPRRLLIEVIRANAPLLAGDDAPGRALAERCILASADDYASTRWSCDIPAEVAAEAEAVRKQCIRRYGYTPAETARHRAELLAEIDALAGATGTRKDRSGPVPVTEGDRS